MQGSRTIAFHTLGCKLNFSESSAISRTMQGAGYTTVPFGEAADVYVINTCSVTDQADGKCRNAVRRARHTNADARVVVIGCYAQLKPGEIAGIPGVDLVLGAAEKFRLPEILAGLPEKGCSHVLASGIDAADFFVPAYSAGDRTRSFLKIQDGCDYKCSFCTIPLARGRSRSDTPENIVRSAREIAAAGIREIVLTGVNTGDYGKGIPGNFEFFDIVRLLDGLDEVGRIRISSVEPNLLKDEIIGFVAGSRRFMPHFHMPLQSGSDKLLGTMRRRYRRELYTDRVERILELMPHACIGVDVIVGFPGETENDFLETYNYLRDLDIAYLHVFTYSERPNTRAVELGESVPMEVRRERNHRLRILSDKKRAAFYGRFTGQKANVLFEEERQGDLMTGYTENYIKVSHPYREDLVGRITEVVLGDWAEGGTLEASLSAVPEFIG